MQYVNYDHNLHLIIYILYYIITLLHHVLVLFIKYIHIVYFYYYFCVCALSHYFKYMYDNALQCGFVFYCVLGVASGQY